MSPQRPQPAPNTALPPGPTATQGTPTVSLRGPLPDSTAVWTPAPTVIEAAAPAKPVGKLGRFELRQRLGGGSFGEVFRAYDPQLDREVALKIARSHVLDDPDEQERFFREGRAAAQFSHPHIVPIYEVGQEGSAAYIVAALIEGTTLGDALAAKRPSSADAVRIVLELADAVHYAHLKGVFHRDLKPGNVMCDRAGAVHLTDFGLARRSEGEALQTQAGEVLGTPAYMSPEQARGDSRLVDARSDLYSLGVILYELLCGQRPFRGSVFEVLKQVQEHEPEPPRKFNPHTPPDLQAICLKAMAKLPEERYPSVLHFADDLRRWQRSEPVQARRTGPLVRVQKWVRRHPLATGILAFSAAGLLAFAVYWQTRPAWLDVRVAQAGSGSTVTLNGQPVPLNKEGRALISHAPGRYQLVVAAPDHEPHQREVLLVRGRDNAAVASIELDPRFGYVSLTSEPEGVNVEIIDSAGRSVARGTTPYHSPRLAAGLYQGQLLDELELYAPQQVKFEVPIADRLTTVPSVKLAPKFKDSEGLDFVKAVRNRMQQPIQPIQFVETPLSRAIETLSNQEKLTMVLNPKSLDDAGISTAAPVTLQLQGISLESALRLLLAPLQLTHTYDKRSATEWILHITTPEEAESRLTTVVFSVRDLIGTSGDYDTVIRNIEVNVDPSSWSTVGGPGSITVDRALRVISVSQSWSALQAIDDYLTQLRQAKLASERDQVVDPALDAAIERIRQLGGQVVRDEAVGDRPVTGIVLYNTPVTDEDLASFPPLPKLEGVNLSNSAVTSAGLAFLKHVPELRSLLLTSTRVDSEGLDFLTATPNLAQLELGSTVVGDQGLSGLADHPQLLRLNLYRCPITNEALATLRTCKLLRFLVLSRTQITDDGVAELAGHPELYSLYLWETPCTDRAAEYLLGMPKLADVSLPRGATDASLVTLAKKPNLYQLHLYNTQITNAGLAELKNFPALRLIAIGGQKIDDEAIPHLEAASNLTSVTVQGSKITADGVKRLRAARPKLLVIQ